MGKSIAKTKKLSSRTYALDEKIELHENIDSIQSYSSSRDRAEYLPPYPRAETVRQIERVKGDG